MLYYIQQWLFTKYLGSAPPNFFLHSYVLFFEVAQFNPNLRNHVFTFYILWIILLTKNNVYMYFIVKLVLISYELFENIFRTNENTEISVTTRASMKMGSPSPQYNVFVYMTCVQDLYINIFGRFHFFQPGGQRLTLSAPMSPRISTVSI